MATFKELVVGEEQLLVIPTGSPSGDVECVCLWCWRDFRSESKGFAKDRKHLGLCSWKCIEEWKTWRAPRVEAADKERVA